MKKTFTFLLCALFCFAQSLKAQPTLVKDIITTPYPAGQGSNPEQILPIGGNNIYFVADTERYGKELWKSDGTEAGTVLVRDICTVPDDNQQQSSDPKHLTYINGTLFFIADDGVHGRELWKSDGTAQGTVMVKDIGAGKEPTTIEYLVNLNGTLFFSTYKNVWKSDGTEAGTISIITATGINANNEPIYLSVIGNQLFVATNGALGGSSLYKSDGTTAGTVLVKNTDLGKPRNFTRMGNTNIICFSADFGSTLARTDGTNAGTYALASFPSNPNLNDSSEVVSVNDKVYCRIGNNLCVTGGTAATTSVIQTGSKPRNLTNVNGTLFFVANQNGLGFELWKLNPTDNSTQLVKDIWVGGSNINSSNIACLTNKEGVLYFSATNELPKSGLWKSDGTANGTVLVKQFGSNTPTISQIVFGNNKLYISTTDNMAQNLSGNQLWLSDGTASGTSLLKDIQPNAPSSNPSVLTNVNGKLLFAINKNHDVWKTEGTPQSTVSLLDETSNILEITNMNGTAYINANGKIWKNDSTQNVFLKDIFSPIYGIYPGHFMQNTETDVIIGNGSDIWVSNGTPQTTILLKTFENYKRVSKKTYSVMNNILYFGVNHANGLWRTDGAVAGTYKIKETEYEIGNVINVNGTLFYFNRGLWKSNGTGAGNVLVAYTNYTINDAAAPFGNTLFFINNDFFGEELWKSDGTTSGTSLLKDINTGGKSSNIAEFTNVNGTMFFVAEDDANGRELWKTDGTTAGTVLVKNISPGSQSSYPTNLINVNGTLFFTANPTGVQTSIWKSDGTEAGTVAVPSGDLANFNNFALVGDKLYFTAHNPTHGTELWYVSTGIIATQTINFPSIASRPYGDPSFKLNATASSGLTVTYTSSNPAVATIVGNTVTIVGGGTTNITASQAGNNVYSAAAPVVRPFVVTKINQTITFNALGTKKYTNNVLNLTPEASTSSNLPVVYTSSNPNVATISGNELTMVNLGNTTITASQPGNDNYNAATNVSRNLTIIKGDQIIAFENVTDKVIGDAPFTLPATTNVGLPITYTSSNNSVVAISGNTVTIVGVGVSIVQGSQAGDNLYNAASNVSRNIIIGKISQTITFPAIADKLPTEAPFALNATSSAGLPVSYAISTVPTNNVATLSGNTVTILGEGIVTIIASQVGNATHNAALNVIRTFNVSKLTNIQSNLPASALTVYPNPSERGVFTIKGIHNIDKQKVTYQLFDESGKVIQSGTWVGNDIEKLELATHINGTYTLLIVGSNSQISKKLVKQN